MENKVNDDDDDLLRHHGRTREVGRLFTERRPGRVRGNRRVDECIGTVKCKRAI